MPGNTFKQTQAVGMQLKEDRKIAAAEVNATKEAPKKEKKSKKSEDSSGE